MPPLESADHYQDAVLWEVVGTDAYGNQTVAEPIDIKVRWETLHKEVIDELGVKVAVSHIVHISRDIPLGSILWQGQTIDLPLGTSDPDDLYEAVIYEWTSDLKNRYVNRALMLRAFRDSLPGIC